MYRVVGWLVVAGFALYGATLFARNHIVADKTDDRKDEGMAAPTV
jgi:phosphatidylserine synthase